MSDQVDEPDGIYAFYFRSMPPLLTCWIFPISMNISWPLMPNPVLINPIFAPSATRAALALQHARIFEALHDGQVRVMYRLPFHRPISPLLCVCNSSQQPITSPRSYAMSHSHRSSARYLVRWTTKFAFATACILHLHRKLLHRLHLHRLVFPRLCVCDFKPAADHRPEE